MIETMNIFYFHLVITIKAYDVDNKVSPRTIDNKKIFKLLSMRENDRTTEVLKMRYFFIDENCTEYRSQKLKKKKFNNFVN